MISKILEGIIAQTAFDITRRGIDSAFKDHLMLAILRSEGSQAHRLLQQMLKDWQLYQLSLRIENRIVAVASEHQVPELFFRGYIEELVARFSYNGSRVTTIHAITEIIGDITTISSKVFALYGITASNIEEQAEVFDTPQAEANNYPITIPSEVKSGIIERLGTDLTDLARQGKIDTITGRDIETERVVQILSRRKKNNPVLVGEAGVGKSAIVEGLALRIVRGDVPPQLIGKRIISLDISQLVAGTKYRGEFEERMQQLVEQLIEAKDIIIFIDEIHTIVGAGSTQGSLDTANILKPALARGQIQTIGATTAAEYRRDIERDAALDRRFQRVIVEPTTPEQTMEILRNIVGEYECHHGVKYTDQALSACVEFAQRYISERQFPDKAIDLLDEAGAYIALTRGHGENNQVSREDIAHTLTTMTGIPAQRINGTERQQLASLEQNISHRVVGQQSAIAAISQAIRRARAGLREPNRPMGVYIFVGPTGVGKTLIAKQLAQWMSGSSDAMIRLDMSEYSQKHNVARLFGSPPGYVGYGEGGQLTEAVRRRPYSVILLDEIEKAHPDIFNALLQLFDEGKMTDGEGRTADFRNTIIIMTSNAGSKEAAISQPIGYKVATAESSLPKSDYHRALERIFAPEFINRVDEIIFFDHLSVQDAQRIVTLELDAIINRLKGLGYHLTITPEVVELIVSSGFEAKYGARSLKRTITKLIEEPLSNMIINGEVAPDKIIIAESNLHQIELRVA